MKNVIAEKKRVFYTVRSSEKVLKGKLSEEMIIGEISVFHPSTCIVWI